MEEQDFTKAKVGDKVTCQFFGKGIITDVRNKEYGIIAEFSKGFQQYNNKGLTKHREYRLFNGHGKFELTFKLDN